MGLVPVELLRGDCGEWCAKEHETLAERADELDVRVGFEVRVIGVVVLEDAEARGETLVER